jgi:hypothetical protein
VAGVISGRVGGEEKGSFRLGGKLLSWFSDGFIVPVGASRGGWLALARDFMDREPDMARAILFRSDIFSLDSKPLDLSLAFGDLMGFGLFT